MYKRVKAPFRFEFARSSGWNLSFTYITNGEIKFLETDFTKKGNVKKQRCFDRSMVIFKLKNKIFACAQIHTKR